MFFVIGIIALLQVTVLPGAVLLRFLRPRGLNAIEQAVGVFASSLMLNHVLVALFTLLHFQRAAAWWVVMLAEVVYLLIGIPAWSRFWSIDLRQVNKLKFLSKETLIAGLFLAATLIIMLALFRQNWGTVYVGNDDVANWDRWATEWSLGHFPTLTTYYPQLLPANGSISYTLLGSIDIKMFAKATTPLYTLFAVLLFLSLAIRRRDPAYLLAGTLYLLMVLHYMGPVFILYGYADLPVAFFAFLSFYCIAASATRPHRYAVLAMLFFAIGALLTKQGAFFAIAAAVGYAAIWTFRLQKSPDDGGRLIQRDTATFILVFFAAFGTAWYLGKFIQIRLGYDYSNIALLTQALHHGLNYYQRVIAIWQKFLYQNPINPFVTIPLSVLLAASLLFKRTRAITAFLVLPFLLAYAFWFSYEIRNSLMAFPFVALVCAGAFHEILNRIRPYLNPARTTLIAAAIFCLFIGRPGKLAEVFLNPAIGATFAAYWPPLLGLSLVGLLVSYVNLSRRIVVPAGALSLLALAGFTAWGAFTHPSDALLAQQKDLARKNVGDPAITASLYRVIQEKHIQSGIATYYWYLRGLPEIRQLFRQTGDCAPCGPPQLQGALQEFPGVHYIMVPDTSFSSEALKSISNSTQFATVFDVDGWRMIEYHP